MGLVEGAGRERGLGHSHAGVGLLLGKVAGQAQV